MPGLNIIRALPVLEHDLSGSLGTSIGPDPLSAN